MPSSSLRPRIWIAAAAALALLAGLLSAPAAPAQGDRCAPGAAYKNPRLPVATRVNDLLGRMTLAEKLGQMGQINVWVMQGSPDTPWDRGPLNPALMQQVLVDNHIGSILSGGGAPPQVNSPKAWAEMTNEVQRVALTASCLQIPIVYGVDAVHGHNNVLGATMYPHNQSLGASGDVALANDLAKRTARAVRATGIHWNFGPIADTARDLRWGRYYEPFGEDPFLGGEFGASQIAGMQRGDIARGDAVAATTKHFLGYSAPDNGHDRANATISPQQMWDIHIPPFQRAIEAGAETAMANSGSVNGEAVHASHSLLTELLRDDLGFEGLLVSDWEDIIKLFTERGAATDYEDAMAKAINAGIDMSMIPLDAPGFTTTLRAVVDDGRVSMARIDQAVGRVLALKFRLGLFERPFVDEEAAERRVDTQSDHTAARKAAEEGSVLLENDGTLPLSTRTRRVLVTGPAADSAQRQLGGWSIGWQGAYDPNEIPEVTTILEGVQQNVSGVSDVLFEPGVPADGTTPTPAEVKAARDAAVAAARRADVVIAAIGEQAYAEGPGDTETAALPAPQGELVDALLATGKPVVLVVVAGRPLMMNDQLDEASATLYAGLPGTEGGAAVGRTLFGKVSPSARLSVTWPDSIAQAPIAYNEPRGEAYDPRYAFGHGLSYLDVDYRSLRAPATAGPDDTVEVTVELRNGGDRPGDELVQVFAERRTGPATAPARQLVAFERVKLGAGERERVTLEFPVSLLAATPAEGGRPAVAPGEYRLRAGNRSRTLTVE
jgi:beta-glucosidase